MSKAKDKKLKYYVVLCACVGAFFGSSIAVFLIPDIPHNQLIGGVAGALINAFIIWKLLSTK